MIRVLTGIVLGFIFSGCSSNMANLRHFPSSSRVDYGKLDSLQDKGTKPHRFFYNCNFEKGNGFTYLYLRTEISQDFMCGPEINRAEGILEGICGQKDVCLEAKELTEETKNRVWPKQNEDGGLQEEERGKDEPGNVF